MKILILSTGTGEGHNSAGKAVLEQFSKRGIPCEMADALDFASEKAAYYGKKVYVWSTVKAKGVFWGAYKAGKAITSAKHKSPVYYANALYAQRLYEYIMENGIDTIVMPHLFPAEAVTFMMKKYRPSVKTYFIATDYTCIPFTEETEMDYYFIPHEDLKEEFCKRGIPMEKLVPTGIPVSERFLDVKDRKEARNSLGIGQEGKCVLVMTGSMGYGHVETLVEHMVKRMDAGTHVFVMGGSNEKLKARLREVYGQDARVEILDFTDRTQDYLAASDILFTKPGGLTSTEAAVAGIPLAHTNPIPGCEERNVAFFTARGMSISDKNEERIVQKGLELMADTEAINRMLASQRQNANPAAAGDICEFILSKA